MKGSELATGKHGRCREVAVVGGGGGGGGGCR